MNGQLSPTGRFERILLASDGSEYCADAERTALAMMEKCGGTLQIVSVVITNPAAESIAPERIQAAEQETRALLDRLHAEAVKRGIQSETILRRGLDPHVEIVTAAEKHGSDVIVMGRRGKRGLMQRMIGDATSKVVGSARCSVLVVPEGAGMWQKRILLATDGSRFADAAAVTTTSMAGFCKAKSTVVSVTTPGYGQENRQEAEQVVQRIVEHMKSEGIDAEGLVLDGRPDELIVAAARDRDADLIVTGSHGRTGFERVLLGSTTERILNETDCAVLVVKGV